MHIVQWKQMAVVNNALHGSQVETAITSAIEGLSSVWFRQS